MTRFLRREAVQAEIRQRQHAAQAYRDRFPDAQRFVRDHYQEEWEGVRDCRTQYRVYESKDHPGRFKVTPYACWNTPYCILCTRAKNRVHAAKALDRFHRVTPKGRKPRFIHIVITAPATRDGHGWGWRASQDIAKFASVVRRFLEHAYGKGIGGVMSYHDFGEQGFAKRHPHMDLTLNGWRIQEQRAQPLGPLDFQGQGRQRLDEALAHYATAIQVDARPGNLDVSRIVEGVPQYAKVLRYQMRELVDFRKIRDDAKRGVVEWTSYKDASRQRFTAQEFRAA